MLKLMFVIILLKSDDTDQSIYASLHRFFFKFAKQLSNGLFLTVTKVGHVMDMVLLPAD